jgi:hypothetical protein
VTISIKALKPGDVVYDARMTRMGNTTMRRLSVWEVRIVEVNESYVVARWNGNPAKNYYARAGKLPWRRTSPKKREAGK